MKFIADDKIPYLKGILDPYAEVIYKPGGKIGREDVEDADGLIIRTRTKCNRALLEGSAVKFIATATIGYDHIDRDYCRENNIQWTNAPGCNSSSVQQYIASVLGFLTARSEQKLEGKTLGIIGVGNVGSKIEKLARILNMKVLLNDPPRERQEGDKNFVSKEQIFQEADIISLHVPLNKEKDDKTYHLINSHSLERIHKNAILINSSRGAVVDNQALKKALVDKQIAGAVLDVWENEPDFDQDLQSGLILGTPHIAGYSRDGKANGTAMSVQAISRFFGLDLNDWYPAQIEKPEHPLINIDGAGKSPEQTVFEAIEWTYRVSEDDKRLRKDPGTFEQQRGEYPVRREFQAYTLNAKNIKPEVQNKLKELGFRI